MRTVGRQIGAGPLGQRRAGVGGINQSRRAVPGWIATYEAALDEGGDLILRTTGHGRIAIELGIGQAQRKICLARMTRETIRAARHQPLAIIDREAFAVSRREGRIRLRDVPHIAVGRPIVALLEQHAGLDASRRFPVARRQTERLREYRAVGKFPRFPRPVWLRHPHRRPRPVALRARAVMPRRRIDHESVHPRSRP